MEEKQKQELMDEGRLREYMDSTRSWMLWDQETARRKRLTANLGRKEEAEALMTELDLAGKQMALLYTERVFLIYMEEAVRNNDKKEITALLSQTINSLEDYNGTDV